MQPLKLEDLTAQFDSIVRRYRDGGLIAYREAGELLKYEGGLPEVNRLKISWLSHNHYNAEKKRNDIEIDFLIGTGNKLRQKIIPIEVKFGRNYLYPCLYGYVLVVFFLPHLPFGDSYKSYISSKLYLVLLYFV